jgi:hypothetical protein
VAEPEPEPVAVDPEAAWSAGPAFEPDLEQDWLYDLEMDPEPEPATPAEPEMFYDLEPAPEPAPDPTPEPEPAPQSDEIEIVEVVSPTRRHLARAGRH